MCGSASSQLDEDLPAQGAHYCTPCARYFVTDAALALHTRTKPHKRRCAAGNTAKSECRSHAPCCAHKPQAALLHATCAVWWTYMSELTSFHHSQCVCTLKLQQLLEPFMPGMPLAAVIQSNWA